MRGQFDTSGCVCIRPGDTDRAGEYVWSDLDPFTQGYVEALFASGGCWPGQTYGAFRARGKRPLAFSDLAPETLARIMEDCERYRRPRTSSRSAAVGALFWKNRAGNYLSDDGWEVLTPYLGEDGKVYLAPQPNPNPQALGEVG